MIKSICIILGLPLFQESSYIIRKKTGRTRGNKTGSDSFPSYYRKENETYNVNITKKGLI